MKADVHVANAALSQPPALSLHDKAAPRNRALRLHLDRLRLATLGDLRGNVFSQYVVHPWYKAPIWITLSPSAQ